MYQAKRARGRCTRSRRRIASARTSTRRRCSRAAACRRAATDGGWLNRALAELQRAGGERDAIALADKRAARAARRRRRRHRGRRRSCPTPTPTCSRACGACTRTTDPRLARSLIEALDARDIARRCEPSSDAAAWAAGAGGQIDRRSSTAAARFLKSPNGPRVAVIDIGGWDTHANQGASPGQPRAAAARARRRACRR